VAWHAAAVRDPLSAILFAVPNGEDRDMVTAALLSGTVDLILPLAPGSVGFRMGHPAHCCALLSPPPAAASRHRGWGSHAAPIAPRCPIWGAWDPCCS
jgi:hypothetical protein